LTEESIKETKGVFLAKLVTIEKDVIEKAFGENGMGPHGKFDFTAHEETIRKLERRNRSSSKRVVFDARKNG
jgi:hypothetical protein